jgi:hypothetical protein
MRGKDLCSNREKSIGGDLKESGERQQRERESQSRVKWKMTDSEFF